MEQSWTGKTYGNTWMHRWLIRLLRIVDMRPIYVICAVFIIPVTLVISPGGRYIYRFFRQRMGYGRLHAACSTYVNHCLFSQLVIDKFAMWAGKKFKIELVGYDNYLRLDKEPEGFVQLSSHFGNYEIAGYSLHAVNKPFNALVFWGEKKSVMANRNRMFGNTNIHMIPISEDMSHMFEINRVLSDGETLSIPADRIYGSEKFIRLDFLGAEAHFPYGPFAIATQRCLKVLSVNVVKTSARQYKIIVKPLDYDTSLPRRQQIEQLARSYVADLEANVREYPTQWYNFFDFWHQ